MLSRETSLAFLDEMEKIAAIIVGRIRSSNSTEDLRDERARIERMLRGGPDHEFMRDGPSVKQTVPMMGVTGGVVGGALYGPPGAILGAVAGALSSSVKPHALRARIASIDRILEQRGKEKTAGKRTDEVLHALTVSLRKPVTEEHRQAWTRHSALNAKQALSQAKQAVTGTVWDGSKAVRKEEAKDALQSLAFTLMPPNHHKPGDLVNMRSQGSVLDWLRGKEKRAAESGLTLYHGSRHKIEVLRKGSYVTPYREDAASFAVPWDSRDLVDKGTDPSGRPPLTLQFKKRPPPDHPLYVYRVDAKTKPALTNTGRKYAWNRVTTEEDEVDLVQTIPSWQDAMLKKAQTEGRETLPVRYMYRADLKESAVEKKAAAESAEALYARSKETRAKALPVMRREQKRLRGLGFKNILPLGSISSGTNLPDEGVSDLDINVGVKDVAKASALYEEKTGVPFTEIKQNSWIHRHRSSEGFEVEVKFRPVHEIDYQRAGSKRMSAMSQEDKKAIVAEKYRLKNSGDRDAYRAYKWGVYEKYGVLPPGGDWSLVKKAEYAKGLPDKKKTSPVRLVEKPEHWRMVLQSHPAQRAGQHTDLRLTDPAPGGISHSWATKKDWPKPGERIRLFQQPDHKPSYSDFQGHLLSGYGKTKPGSKGVQKVMDERVEIKRTSDKLIRFDVFRKEGELPDRYVLVKAKHDGKGHPPWVLINHGKAKTDQVPVK